MVPDVAERLADELWDAVDLWKSEILSDNRKVLTQVKNKVTDYKQSVSQLDVQIAKLSDEIVRLRSLLNRLYRQIGFKCMDKTRPEVCIANAKKICKCEAQRFGERGIKTDLFEKRKCLYGIGWITGQVQS